MNSARFLTGRTRLSNLLKIGWGDSLGRDFYTKRILTANKAADRFWSNSWSTLPSTSMLTWNRLTAIHGFRAVRNGDFQILIPIETFRTMSEIRQFRPAIWRRMTLLVNDQYPITNVVASGLGTISGNNQRRWFLRVFQTVHVKSKTRWSRGECLRRRNDIRTIFRCTKLANNEDGISLQLTAAHCDSLNIPFILKKTSGGEEAV